MKYFITLLTAITVIIFACKTGNRSEGLIAKPGDMPADEYVISIDKDTTLVTKNGALLKIPKGTLSNTSGSTVTLEIKEAYSLEQMIMYGLATTSDGEPLSSGGMIYINAKGGQDVKITQAIKVAIPANYLNPEMQLFKGETGADGNINWTDPTALPENKQITAIEEGRQLFENRCAGCHSIGKDMIGPDLAHILRRFPYGEEGTWRYFEHGYQNKDPYKEYSGIYTIVQDSLGNEKRIFDKEYFFYHPQSFDIYKCNLVSRYSSTGPRMFTDSSNLWLEFIYKYIQNESDRRQLPLPAHAFLSDCADSCAKYKKKIFELQKQKRNTETKKTGQIEDNEKLTEEKRNPGNLPQIQTTDPLPVPAPNFEDIVSPDNNEAVYYQFSIETFGWYNIDVLLKDVTGNEESELFVRIVGTYREKLDIFLIIPEQKIYTKAGKKKGGTDEYVFAYTNGKIFLPQNAKAYIMAVSESSSSVAFVLKVFTTSIKQELEIELKAASKEEFNLALNKLNAAGDLRISVKDTKNADSIRKTNADLITINEELKKAENLKPSGCDCNCGDEGRPLPRIATEFK